MEKAVGTSELRQVYHEYLEFEKQHVIPPKIRDKLVCLAKLVLGEPIDPAKF